LIEDVAIAYTSQAELTITLIGVAFGIVGAILAGFTNRSESELARAPYFVYSSLITFALSVVPIVWLLSVPALAGGYLWVLMVISFAAPMASGFSLSKIAIARSRDACGHGRRAVLAFMPFVNLWLFLAPSKNALSANRVPTIPLLTGGLGVLSGFALLVGAGLVSAFIEQETPNPASPQADIELMINSNGLEETLHRMAATSGAPIILDEVTTLARVEAVGTQLRRTYVVNLEDITISDDFRADTIRRICTYGTFVILLRAGAAIHEVYVRQDGQAIGDIMVARSACEF